MRCLVTRDVFLHHATLSRLAIVYDGPLAFTEYGWKKDGPRGPLDFSFVCEDRDRGLDAAMPLDEIEALKVKKETCIPVGIYALLRTPSQRFAHKCPDGKMLEVQKVPGYRGIRVHSGNTHLHTEGCPLPGFDRDVKAGTVARSTIAWQWRDARVKEATARGEACTWEVSRDPAAWSAFLATE